MKNEFFISLIWHSSSKKPKKKQKQKNSHLRNSFFKKTKKKQEWHVTQLKTIQYNTSTPSPKTEKQKSSFTIISFLSPNQLKKNSTIN